MTGKRSHRWIWRLPALFGFLFIAFQGASGWAGEDEGVRRSILAGTWYPRSSAELIKTVEGFLANARGEAPDGELKAIVVPHAGYMYSGQVAGYAYRLLQGRPFKRVILVGPSHRVAFRGFSVNLQAGYETPLGVVPVDQALGKKIMTSGNRGGWVKRAHEAEHSLEIQLPFLQRTLGPFRIVPILMGEQDYGTASELADSIARAAAEAGDTLLLASCDLSHFHDDDRARALDREFIRHIAAFDPEGLNRALSSGACEACGGGPVVSVLLGARALGADRSIILQHANSGDVTGDRSRVVGYLSAALIKASGKDPRPR